MCCERYMDEALDIYLCGDQPTECGLCGARTTFVHHGPVQCHECKCGYRFYVVSDDEEENSS
jgi:hypothetical protein